jgi:hypothetical protein
MLIRIDNQPFLIHSTDAPNLTEAQRDLLKILCAVGSLSGNSTIRSQVLMELLGLKRTEALECRLKNLRKHGVIQSRESIVSNLEDLLTA